MSMFCFQCQETAKGTGCTIAGVCGKTEKVANMQDLLVFVVKGMSYYTTRLRDLGIENAAANKFIIDSLFMTITNANFDQERFVDRIREGLKLREEPRVLDAGQCNDSYSLAVIALKLKEVFNLKDINDLPITFNIAWYEQKAVIVLLALLYLGVKNIHLGPTLPGFLSPNVAKVLVEKFGIAGIGTVEDDIKSILPTLLFPLFGS